MTNSELALQLKKANLKVISLTERRRSVNAVIKSRLEGNIKVLLLEKLEGMDDVITFQSYCCFNFGIKFK